MALSLLAAISIARVIVAAPHGLQVIGDSFYYVTGSENLAALRGFGRLSGGGDFIPITHYPPFFSLAMAVPQLVGVEKLDSALLVNVGSYAGLVVVVGLLVKLQTGSNVAALLPAALLGLSPILFENYLLVMSEPLFLVLGFSGFLFLWSHLQKGSTISLVLGAALLALALLTRYLGVAFIGAGALVLMLTGPAVRVRLRRLMLFLAVSLPPMALWLLRNLSLTGNLANRNVLWHPPTYQHLRGLTLSALEWFVPPVFVKGRYAAFAWILIATALLVWFAAARRKSSGPPGNLRARHLERMLLVLVPCYLLALAASLTLIDPSTPVNNRILAPVYVSAIVLLALYVREAWGLASGTAKYGMVGLVAFLVSWYGYEQFQDAMTRRQHALDYPPRHLLYSPTIEAVRGLPQATLISNALPSLYFAAGRYAYSIPWRINSQTNAPNPGYPEELSMLRKRVREDCALLVLFDPANLFPEQAPLGDLTEGLVVLGEYSDGVIYRHAEAEEACGW